MSNLKVQFNFTAFKSDTTDRVLIIVPNFFSFYILLANESKKIICAVQIDRRCYRQWHDDMKNVNMFD